MRLRGVALIAVAVLALSACSSDESAAPESAGGFVAGDGSIVVVPEAERQLAPEVAGTTLDGTPLALADHLGEVVVLNVWASWCAPCRAEAPELEEVSQEFADSGVQFIGLNTRDSETSAKAFLATKGVTFPSLVDADGQLQLKFADTLPPKAIPSTLVIDPQGRVAARALGAVSAASLRAMIEPLLEAPTS